MLIFHVVAFYCLLMARLNIESDLCSEPTITQVTTRAPTDTTAISTEKPDRIRTTTVEPDRIRTTTVSPDRIRTTTVGTDRIRTTTVEPDSSQPTPNPTLSCGRNEDCPERQECIHSGNETFCSCSLNHNMDSLGQCIKSCNTDEDCNPTERCVDEGDIKKCICSSGRVWNYEYEDCIKDCSSSSDICETSTETCRKLGNTSICQCSFFSKWVPYRSACARTCVDSSDCDDSIEYCDGFSTGNKICFCRLGMTWNFLAGGCITDYTCQNDDDCREHERCQSVDESSVCICDQGYQQNSQHQCIKPCTTHEDCGFANSQCSGNGVSKSCECLVNRAWSNKHNACMKRCTGDYECDIERETCEVLRDDIKICVCQNGYIWYRPRGMCAEYVTTCAPTESTVISTKKPDEIRTTTDTPDSSLPPFNPIIKIFTLLVS